ncbi:STAS/SEC14 domain-containing protein [Ketobacter sp.]|uniref:STAS/SEC14 domain-containing protein n=1 Tax=Ketobacter sp. TaxID=2083498 RepID=UPI0025B98132|nr:hypothetical protein [Ketobacter sp.]
MSYNLEVIAQEGYIRVTATTDINRTIAAQMADETTRRLKAENLEAALIDVRSRRNVEFASQNYHFANADVPALSLRKTDRIAVLADPDDDSHDFIEIVMRNTGYNLRIFRDEEEALAWLKI